MSRKVRLAWLPGILFIVTVAAALALAGLVVLAPAWLAESPQNRLLRVFALDNTVRRTSLASAVGLAVTALVFFRPGKAARPSTSPGRRSPPVNIPGA